jgi:hypothetical protein
MVMSNTAIIVGVYLVGATWAAIQVRKDLGWVRISLLILLWPILALEAFNS